MTADDVKRLATAAAFDLCGIASAEPFAELGGLSQWLARGFAGEMHYLARTEQARLDPRHVLPGARSVIVLGTLYNTERPYSIELADPAIARISRYAWGDDYHLVIRRRLDDFVRQLGSAAGEGFAARAYVDTGPVQERAFAQRAGLGWIGKNACLINPQRGSWFFLAVVLTTLALPVDEPEPDHCGTCSLCLEACPTQAFDGPGRLDARRCLSYLTIELRGDVPPHLRAPLGTHVFGCDICQEVCPYNQDAPVSTDPAWQPRPVFDRPGVRALARLDDESLRVAMRRSAMKRAGVAGLRRTLAIAEANLDRRGED